jgi:hypothetical protein
VQRLQVELVVGLDRNKAHVLAVHRLSDGLGIQKVVLVRLHKGLDELGRDELHIVALCSQRTTQEVGPAACLHPDERSLQVRCERDQLSLRELLLQQHLAVIVKRYQVKRRLAKVNPYRTNLHVDDPP